MRTTVLIGVDCATQVRRTGIARGRYESGRLVNEEVARGSDDLLQELARWIEDVDRAVLALDAPLGWPVKMGDALRGHRAGEPVSVARSRLFRRETDRQIEERVGVRPLQVGADRIAHTAHAALSLLEQLRSSTGQPIPLAWKPDFRSRLAAIEVYPAATLHQRELPHRGYKGGDDLEKRQQIVDALSVEFDGQVDERLLLHNADVLDAWLCLLAAADFLAGRCVSPTDPEQARREGWIWTAGDSGG